jgi:hypothetical protein
VPSGRGRKAHADQDRPARGGVRARSLGWTAVITAVAATTILVPPLVAPKTHHGAGTATAPPVAQSRVATQSPTIAESSSPATSASATHSPSVTQSPRIAPSFSTIRLHAADPANLRSGARIIPCGSCDGGRRVGYIGGPNTLVMLIRGVTAPGKRTLTVTYETDGPRTLKIGVNNGPIRTLLLTGAHDFLIPALTSLSVFIPAGASTIKFFNDAGSAPDINGIVIS